MGYINTRPNSATVRNIPVHCPLDNQSIWSVHLRDHLARSTDKGGHGMPLPRASLYASRTIQSTLAATK